MGEYYSHFKRMQKLLALGKVVLLGGRDTADSIISLEGMIHRRIDKEFLNPSDEEREIIEGIKQDNLTFADRTIKDQRDGEIFTQIKADVRERDLHLFHRFSDPVKSTAELEVLLDTSKRAGANSITLYLYYVPWQRQDKKDDGRVPITAKLFFDKLTASAGHRLKRIVGFDLHARQAQGFFDGPLDELSAVPEFAAYYKHKFKDKLSLNGGSESKNLVEVISPDAGGAKRARYLANLLKVQYQVLDKVRTGHGEATTNFYLTHNIEGKDIILVDDMIDSAGSVVGEYENEKNGPIQFLKSRGAKVYVCATHGVFSEKNGIPAERRFRREGTQVLITNSFPEKYGGYYAENNTWLTVLSLDYAFAKSFYCNQVGESMSGFIQNREKLLRADKLNVVTDGGMVSFIPDKT
jgi:ribose-phosphate pyrophosphokinase